MRPPYPFPRTQNPSPWQIFHLQPSASQSDIKARYYALARLYHPDSPLARAVSSDVAHERFHAIRAAYDTLTGKHQHHHHNDSDDLWRELAARRRQHERRRSHGVPEWDARGDDWRKDQILLAVGCFAAVLGVAPAFANWTEHREPKHRVAAANLAAARSDARELAAARREGIRSRIRDLT